ncbi:MAG: DEAD/DEAH box helicase, partial [Clostridia bacterium]|nr:DEAD/DEAH box helicase [Clostridia bacterium]
FPFSPTLAQENTIKTILEDLKKDKPMSRLVEGDVGSGKTFVAATIAYAVIKNHPVGLDFGNVQVAYMAPTEVLATQLFENFINYFDHTGISIGLMTSSGCRKFPSKSAGWENGKQIRTWTTISRNQLLKWVKNGEIPIVIGTHSLISKSVDFEDLGLVIIDEQHRFGTNQRMKLAKKEGHSPHYLSMTATPIPRTLALTIYGDLDLSIIDEMPAGRKKVITEIVSENKRELAYDKIREELRVGRQLYVICPKIDEQDSEEKIKLDVKSVTSEAKRLKKDVFPEYEISIMHSKMSKQKKEQVMEDFKSHKVDILVSTSVIEVGVNVPNATVIIIEGAERFGLAQLHQLRGRVIRSTYQSFCYLFANAKVEKTMD